MAHATNIPLGFSVIPFDDSIPDTTQYKKSIEMVDPINCQDWPEPRVWCDCDMEVNPHNGRFGVLIREECPKEVIWELNGVYFALGENKLVAFNPPSIIRS